ncbi:MAG: hypothetical protein ACK4JF_03650 [Methylohalobius sp.]
MDIECFSYLVSAAWGRRHAGRSGSRSKLAVGDPRLPEVPPLPELHFTNGREKIAQDRLFCMSNAYAFADVSLILGRMD